MRRTVTLSEASYQLLCQIVGLRDRHVNDPRVRPLLQELEHASTTRATVEAKAQLRSVGSGG